jgi:hypothetical protein
VSNAWTTYPGVGDNPAKAGLIPNTLFFSWVICFTEEGDGKGGLWIKLPPRDGFASH